MKLVFTADVHFDSTRGGELLAPFCDAIEYAKKINAAAFIIGGDLFDSPYASKEVCATVRATIAAASDLKFLAVCGNHDPLYTTAFYKDLPDNMFLFGAEVEKYPLGDIDIYGVSMKTETDSRDPWQNFRADGRFITLSHGALDGNQPFLLSSRTLADTGAMLSLMGHIHKSQEFTLSNGRRALYSGCLAGRGFDECGQKGFYVIDTDSFEYEFIPSNTSIYKEYEIDISGSYDTDSLLAIINSVEVSKNEIARARLVGKLKSPLDIDTSALLSVLPQFVELKDESTVDIDLFENISENTLEGEFIRILEAKLKDANDQQKAMILDAIKEGVIALRRI